jgi:hypothetical protein
MNNKQYQQKRHIAKRAGHLDCRGGRESLTTSQMEKAGAAAHTQQPGAGTLVKVAVGGKLHRRWGKIHFPHEL